MSNFCGDHLFVSPFFDQFILGLRDLGPTLPKWLTRLLVNQDMCLFMTCRLVSSVYETGIRSLETQILLK